MFQGVYTAVVTPFRDDGDVDYAAYRALLEFQIEQGVDGLVPVGTTGESPTLTMEEHLQVIQTAVEVCRDRVPVIAGTGGNATAEALELTRRAKDMGVAGTLQVTPYYNKPSQTGLMRHFTAVADLGLPVMLYNIPGRTGRAIEVDTVAELARHPQIVAVKEAGGSVDQVSRYRQCCDLDILSGDDVLTLPMMAVGAVGVVSVAANLIPKEVASMVHAALRGEWDTARSLHEACYTLFRTLLTLDTNPVPVKTALALTGRCSPAFRLPLSPLSAPAQDALRAVLERHGLI